MLLLKDIIIILFSAVLIILVLARFRVPPVIGFLLTGIIIGPGAFQLVQSVNEIEVLAEIGIILLMFTIGLEFSVEKIRHMFKDFILFGGLQIILCWLVFYGLLYLYGLPQAQALLGGFLLAFSSTAIVLKLLQDNGELGTPSGLKTTAILLFQDAIVMPAIIILPFISQLDNVAPLSLVTDISLAFGGVILIFAGSKFLLPKIFSTILKLRITDLLTITVFVFLFGVALVAHHIGVSMAMGAFIVGIAISDSDYMHQIKTDIIPSRHIFNSIFFVSIGMFVNIDFFLDNALQIVLFTALIIVLKIIIITALFPMLGGLLNVGVMTAFGLAHIGEFTFILLSIAQSYAFFSPDTHQLILSVSILSMFTIPVAIHFGKRISGFDKLKKELADSAQTKPLANHTIIAGYGINGQNISRILKLLGIHYTIVEMNSTTVKKFKAQGEPIHFGNIDRNENMKMLGISKAALLVIAINDMEAAGRAVMIARDLNPNIKILVRVNYISQADSLYSAGADLVLSQDMETSLVFIHHILKFYNLPDHVSRIQTEILRKENYRFFVKDGSKEAWKIAIIDYVDQDSELFFISPSSKHVGQKVEELEPFAYDDLHIIGIIRHSQVINAELSKINIEKFDTLIFSGNHKNVSRAITWMEENN